GGRRTTYNQSLPEVGNLFRSPAALSAFDSRRTGGPPAASQAHCQVASPMPQCDANWSRQGFVPTGLTANGRLGRRSIALELSFPFGVQGQDGLQVLWEDGDRVFCRGWREDSDGSRGSLLVVLPTAERPLPASLDRLAHEYELRDELDSGWAARPLALAREGDRTALLLEDPGGEPLELLNGAPMEAGRFLRLAIGIGAALGKVHQRGLVHKDIKPAHFLVNCADGQVRLTGF